MSFREEKRARWGLISRERKLVHDTGRSIKINRNINNNNKIINIPRGVLEIIIYIFDQVNEANLDLILFLVRDTSFPAPPGSGVRLIPWPLPPRQDC